MRLKDAQGNGAVDHRDEKASTSYRSVNPSTLQEDDLSRIFDPPRLPPDPERLFAPFPGPYLTGPLPVHLQELTATGLTAHLTGLTPAEAAELVAFGALWLDDRPCLEPDHLLVGHQSFRLNSPAYGPVRFYEADPARVVFEDRDLLIYNKESGRPSQAVPHDAHNNVLAALGRMLAGRGQSSRLWLPHRLDADTSGLLMLAKNKEAAGCLGKAFQQGLVAKKYLCLGLGPVPDKNQFTVDTLIAKEGRRYLTRPLGPGLTARTDFTVLGRVDEALGEPDPPEAPYGLNGRPETGSNPANLKRGWSRVLFAAEPLTGRTHQIRLHIAWAGWPLVGDRLYGRPAAPPVPRLMLASASLTFRHPRDGREIRAELPGSLFFSS